MERIDEKSALPLVVVPQDSNAVAVIPSTLRYRIDDMTNKRVVLEWTSLTPSDSVVINITPTQNTVYSRTKASEVRQLTIEADAGLSSARTKLYQWSIKTLPGF